jgi:putative salt-induced outer membrane protein YdiY
MRTVVSALILVAAGTAAAQPNPKFEYGKKEDLKAVEWKLTAQTGIVLTTGNSRATTISAGLFASRRDADNKLQIELGGAYVRTGIFVANDLNMNGTIDSDGEIDRQSITTTKALSAKARYDRFFTENNSAYGALKLESNQPAGKDLVAGFQLGYSRQLLKSDVHELLAEVGYDFSYENLVAAGDGVVIHSARFFVGYLGKLSADTALNGSLEALFNLNSETTPSGEISAFNDTRLLGKVGLSTKLSKYLSFRFAFTAAFDQAPPPRPPFPGIAYGPGFQPLADTLDTQTEVALIVSFL